MGALPSRPSERTLRLWLAQNVRDLREKLSMTLYMAAELSDMHWRHWQKIEAGECNTTLGTLQRLADALSVSVDALLRPVTPAPGAARGRRRKSRSLKES